MHSTHTHTHTRTHIHTHTHTDKYIYIYYEVFLIDSKLVVVKAKNAYQKKTKMHHMLKTGREQVSEILALAIKMCNG